jgi:protein-L-isoaspartate(D-aspartate) O-methyltransferase
LLCKTKNTETPHGHLQGAILIMSSAQTARRNMVLGQVETNEVLSPDILQCLNSIPREPFVPAGLSGAAYVDEDLPLGNRRYLMEPLVFARLLQLADIQPDDKILDVACGTGYSAAALSLLSDKVVAIECQRELSDQARRTLKQLDIKVEVFTSALTVGYPMMAPYDVIIIEGGVQHVPATLTDQLAEGGRLVGIELKQQRLSAEAGLGCAFIIRKMKGALHRHDVFEAAVPLLPGFEKKKQFEF